MLDKLVFFGIGYVLGTRAGRERFDEMVDFAKWVAGRDEIAAAVTMARSAMEMGMERGREMSTAGAAGGGANWWEKPG
jgi:hypothetical protein